MPPQELMCSASPVQLTLTPLGLDPGASRPWEAAYNRQHEYQCAAGRRGLPTLWGTPCDSFSKHPHKCMETQSPTAPVVLTRPDHAR